MSSFKKGLKKVEVALKWDPSPVGAPPHDLDIIAATYTDDDPGGPPDYVVHFDSRSPTGPSPSTATARPARASGSTKS